MNTPNPSEQRLANWIPRPPSERIRDRLFHSPKPATPSRYFHWPRLLAATATSLALFTIVFTPAREADPIFDSGASRWPVLAPSNQWLASYFVAQSPRLRNALPLQRIEWTNITPSPSSIASPR